MAASRSKEHDDSCCAECPPSHRTRLGSPVSEFEALRADDADLAGLRSAVRAFLAADRETFGWTPAVDCWLSSWDTAFSTRLAEAGFIGLTIPAEYGGRAPADGTGYLHRYVVTEELLAHGAPVGAHWIADRQVAPACWPTGPRSSVAACCRGSRPGSCTPRSA